MLFLIMRELETNEISTLESLWCILTERQTSHCDVKYRITFSFHWKFHIQFVRQFVVVWKTLWVFTVNFT